MQFFQQLIRPNENMSDPLLIFFNAWRKKFHERLYLEDCSAGKRKESPLFMIT